MGFLLFNLSAFMKALIASFSSGVKGFGSTSRSGADNSLFALILIVFKIFVDKFQTRFFINDHSIATKTNST